MGGFLSGLSSPLILLLPLLVVALFVLWRSFWNVGATEVGLVRKRLSFKKMEGNSPIAFHGEAGYQAELLRAGYHFKLWPLYVVERHPMVQVPAGQIGVVIAQVGASLPIGAKSAVYKPEFGDFENLESFVSGGGQKGVQRPVLAPGTVAPIHPIGFLVITKSQVYGTPVDEELVRSVLRENKRGALTCVSFGLKPEQLNVVQIQPHSDGDTVIDKVGIVTTLDGNPLPEGAIASRLGDFEDIAMLEKADPENDAALIETILAAKNGKHNNYQDFQKFLDGGGRIGLQHDPIQYGAYNLNPFLVSVEMYDMLVVNQGQVAVVKSYVGLATEDTSGVEFKFGALVRPGHRGVWREPLRTGKYAINPRCYAVEIVPTSILTLNWADATSKAHEFDRELRPIDAKSKEGFPFSIDLQVQIHVPDTEAPKVISTVGSMYNLVNEVLQAAVGNHFRDKLQGMPAVDFISKRAAVQTEAEAHIRQKLLGYRVETPGVYIQDVALPDDLVKVLQDREIATQNKATFKAEQEAQSERIALEASRGQADMQGELARSDVGIKIAENGAKAVMATADGTAYELKKVGEAAAVKTKAEGLAVAVGLDAQQKAIGRDQTALVNVVKALADGKQRFVPENLALSLGTDGAGGFSALVPQLMGYLSGAAAKPGAEEPAPAAKAPTPKPRTPKAREDTGTAPTPSAGAPAE